MRGRGTVVAAVAAWVLFLGAVAAGLTAYLRNEGGKEALGRTAHHQVFNHIYPPDPAQVERPKVSGHSPRVARAYVVSRRVTIRSFAALARRLPAGTLTRRGRAWVLSRPIAAEGRTTLLLHGPGVLQIAPGAFLMSSHGGTVSLQGLTVVGVDTSGRVLRNPVSSRGFLVASSGGRLVLIRDSISYLGHLGVESYGISLEKPAPGSEVSGCRISHNYFGVYTTHAAGVHIVGNSIAQSVVYGIDPHTESVNLLIEHNQVTGSGVHGIILAYRVSHTRVLNNRVSYSRDHGIVLYDYSNGNVVRGNVVMHTFDGIVVQDSSGNVVVDNRVGPVDRFGLRMSGVSASNLVRANVLSGALVGAYLYEGPRGNRLIGNRFLRDAEFVRIRADALHNLVTPVPPRSEIAATAGPSS